MTQIIRFNWPFYAVAALILISGAFSISIFAIPYFLRAVAVLIIGMAASWLIGSLVIAHYIYDRASIYGGDWIRYALRNAPKR